MQCIIAIKAYFVGLFKDYKPHEITEQANERFFFTDLAPIDDADHESGYFHALKYALDNNKVLNVALSGPYGSGKSSILHSYQSKNGSNFVNISLASFRETEAKNVDTSTIEKSILQQLLYGVDAKNIPYSRFKRITPVHCTYLKAILIVVWLACAYYNWQQDWAAFISNLENYLVFNWSLLRIISAAYVVIGCIILVAWMLKNVSVGLAKIKFSLPGFEVETNENKPTSILSENLDEIFYFFETTKERVVIFEDLDRFEKPEIFHKLREINKLLNDGRSNSEKIKFIYAIRDDIFLQGDRTKFFDFIIPVVPIVNSTNSLDKFRELLQECSALDAIDDQFLRDVCYHLIDLRLIKNIVNEFEIYRDALPNNGLDQTKLLAMMVYKNVYAQDFDALHYQKGKLFQVCSERGNLEQSSVTAQKKRKTEIEEIIERSHRESTKNINDLISAYITPILSVPLQHTNLGIHSLQVGSEKIPLAVLSNIENFEKLVAKNTFGINQQSNHGAPSNLKFQDIERRVDPDRTFKQRKEALEDRAGDKRSKLEQEVRKIDDQLSKIKQKPLSELLNENLDLLDRALGENSSEESSSKDEVCGFSLLRSLLLNGYIDEHYNDFVSNFYEGRLGLGDLEFMRSVRTGLPIDSELKLENPAEVIIDMSDSNFESKYILNVSLFDHLLSSIPLNSTKTKQAINYIAENFEESDSFLVTYYREGGNVRELVVRLAQNWDLISTAVYRSSSSQNHIAMVIKFCGHENIVATMNAELELTKFVEEFGEDLEGDLSEGHSHFELYKTLKVRFPKLAALSDSEGLLNFAITNAMYRINADNIHTVFSLGDGNMENQSTALETSNYTTILESGDGVLKAYIEENIETYVQDVLLELPDNQFESGDAIIRILNNDRVADDARTSFASLQKHIFDDFDGLPEKFIPTLLERGTVEINWRNMVSYLESSVFDQDAFTNLLEEPEVLRSGLVCLDS